MPRSRPPKITVATTPGRALCTGTNCQPRAPVGTDEPYKIQQPLDAKGRRAFYADSYDPLCAHGATRQVLSHGLEDFSTEFMPTHRSRPVQVRFADGRKAVSMDVSLTHACVVLDNGEVRRPIMRRLLSLLLSFQPVVRLGSSPVATPSAPLLPRWRSWSALASTFRAAVLVSFRAARTV